MVVEALQQPRQAAGQAVVDAQLVDHGVASARRCGGILARGVAPRYRRVVRSTAATEFLLRAARAVTPG
jgi:hypothetical protein